jgi:hypothetical protein
MLKEFRSSFKVASISNIFLPLMLKVVSSAYISISDVKFSSGRSFINILKSRGSKMDPCGHPYFIHNNKIFVQNMKTKKKKKHTIERKMQISKADETYCVLRYSIWQIEHTSKDNS